MGRYHASCVGVRGWKDATITLKQTGPGPVAMVVHDDPAASTAGTVEAYVVHLTRTVQPFTGAMGGYLDCVCTCAAL